MATFEESHAQLLAAVLEQNNEEGFQFYAVATNVVDIHNFYLVPLRCYRLLNILENPGEVAEHYAENSMVVYYSATLKHHVRGVVQEVFPNKSCNIDAVDYGITDIEVTPPNIFTVLRPEVATIPGLAHLCQLSMCYPRDGLEFDQDAIDAFKFFMGQGERLTITIKENFSYKLGVLVMSSRSNPDDISTSLAYSNISVYYPARL